MLPGQQQVKMNIDLNSLKPFKCTCGEGIFVKGTAIRVVPRILSPNGQAGFAELDVAKICYACGKIFPVQQLLDDIRKEEAEEPKIILAEK